MKGDETILTAPLYDTKYATGEPGSYLLVNKTIALALVASQRTFRQDWLADEGLYSHTYTISSDEDAFMVSFHGDEQWMVLPAVATPDNKESAS